MNTVTISCELTHAVTLLFVHYYVSVILTLYNFIICVLRV